MIGYLRIEDLRVWIESHHDDRGKAISLFRVNGVKPGELGCYRSPVLSGEDLAKLAAALSALGMPYEIVDETADRREGWTSAPEEYDGFGTVTLNGDDSAIVEERFGPFHHRTIWRRVSIRKEHYNWQTMRYGSGLHPFWENESLPA